MSQTINIKKFSDLKNVVTGQLPQTSLFAVEIDGLTYQVDASKVLSSGTELQPENIQWNATDNYNNGEVVFAFDKFWESTIDDGITPNIGNTPSDGSSFWNEVQKSTANGVGRYATGLYTIDPTIVIKKDVTDSNKDKLYSLVAVRDVANPAYNSVDFDGELLAGDWQLISAESNFQAEINSIEDLDNAISGNKLSWVLESDIILDGNKVIPSGVSITSRNNSKITLGNFNLQGDNTQLSATGLSQIFVINGTGRNTGTWLWEKTTLLPQWFGAVGDGITDDSAAFQNMFNVVTISNPEEILIPAGEYIVEDVNLPPTVDGSAKLRINGYGCKLKTTTSNTTIFNRLPSDQTEASIWVSSAIIIEGITFLGTSLTGQKGLFLGATYGSAIRDCTFRNLDEGCTLAFALMTTVENSLFQSCASEHLLVTYGSSWGGSTSNSQSNSTVIRNNRIYAATGAIACVHIRACSGVYLDNVICEGGNPQRNVYFEAVGSTVVKDFSCRGLHLENTPTLSHITLNSFLSGTCSLKSIFTQYTSVLVETDSSTLDIIVEDVPNLPAGTTFKGDANWIFKNSSNLQEVTYNPAFWDDSIPRGTFIGANVIGSISRNRVNLTVATNNIDLDWGGKNELVSTNIVSVSANATVAYLGVDKAEYADLAAQISNLATLTFPAGTISPDPNFSSLVWTPPTNGTYSVSITKKGSTYIALFTQMNAV
jgi:hypothetical protein